MQNIVTLLFELSNTPIEWDYLDISNLGNDNDYVVIALKR